MKSRKRVYFAAAILIIVILLCSCGSKDKTEVGDTAEVIHSGTALSFGNNSVSITGKDSSHFYYVAEHPGIYVFEGNGGGTVVFYDSDRYKDEIVPETVKGYPDEEFSVLENRDFLYAFDLQAGDTVYFSVTLPEDGDYVLNISEGALTPDRTSCTELIDRFNGSYYTFNYQTMCSADPETDFAGHLHELILGTCTTGASGVVNKSYVTTSTKGVLSNDNELFDYISDEEAQTYGINGGTYFIYDQEIFSQMPDELWGAGRITQYTDDNSVVALSSQGYLFAPEDRSFIVPYELIGIHSFDADNGFAKATIVGLGYDLAHPVYDVNSGEELGINVFLEAYSTLSEASGILNIDLSTLKEKEFVFYNTKEGTRLLCAGSTIPSGASADVPALPSEVPDEFFPETVRTVSAIGGLALVDAPNSSSVILKIPDKYQIRTYAEADGFYYVKYMGRYGWVDSTKCR